MRFTVLQENFSKGLGMVSKAISLKAPLPILSNVLISAENGRLKLSAFNMETGISTYVGASIEEEGAITVPAKLLSEFISNLSSGTITGELKDSVLHFSIGKAKSKFVGMEASDYPELPQLSEKLEVLEVDAKDFSDAIHSVVFSAAVDDSRPVLGGILINYEKGVLTAVSADGFRLSERTLSLPKTEHSFKVVIPAKTLAEVARILGSADGNIKFAIDSEDNLALFESDGVLISTRIIDGEFPDYKKLIPDETLLSAEFVVADLLEAVKLTNVFAKEANSAINLSFDPSGSIAISSPTQETGESKSEVSASIEGEKTEMSFNAKFLLDFLNNSSSEKVVFATNGAMQPGLLKPIGDDSYIHIIMPLRITS